MRDDSSSDEAGRDDERHPAVGAIILAAGTGARLGAAGGGRPKCLVPIAGRPLLAHQLAALRRAGIRDVVVVVGASADVVRNTGRALAAGLGLRLQFIENPRFAETNTIYSQYLARAWLARPCVCLNGDVLFPPSLLPRLLWAAGESALAVDVHRCGAEEVKVVVDPDGAIRRIGKELDPAVCLGEFIGVARYGARAGAAFAAALVDAVERQRIVNTYFEHALLPLAGEGLLAAVPLGGTPAVEIDFPEDLQRARQQVWPRLAHEWTALPSEEESDAR